MRFMNAAMVSAMVLGMSSTAFAAKIQVNDNVFVDVKGFVQPTVTIDTEVADQEGASIDFYVRRSRLIMKGQVAKNVEFMVGTLTTDIGKNGDYTGRTMMADGWIDYGFSPAFKLAYGQMVVPFSRGMQSGSALYGLDMHANVYKRKGTLGNLRDMGVLAHGMLLDNKIDYRVGVFDGIETAVEKVTNDNGTPDDTSDDTTTDVTVGRHDTPRVVGRLGFNVFEAEPDLYFVGTHMGKKKVLSFGLSVDAEPGVGVDKGLYFAGAFDWMAEMPMDKNCLTVQGAAYYYGAGGAMPEGIALYNDLGYRVKKVNPIIGLEMVMPAEGDVGKRTAVLPGVNYWIAGHAANVKFQVGAVNVDAADTWDITATTQAQIGF